MFISAYDASAPSFDRHRALPDGVVKAIRTVVLGSIGETRRPRLLDLGAGTGRIGWPFVAADDDYVAVDLSLDMLRTFLGRPECLGAPSCLVQADGRNLPFPDATFDAVMLIHVLGGMSDWARLVTEARRVLLSAGRIFVGRSVLPADGVDSRMKRRLASLLGDMGVVSNRNNMRDEVQSRLGSVSRSASSVSVACWNADRTPREFLQRHRTGARFSALPQPIREVALQRLEAWAGVEFGSLDTVVSERHAFELRIFKFMPGEGC
jgi:SAM-dependent methyltransferase